MSDGRVLDFTSALYLGLDHPSAVLAGWEQLTLGKPAALEAPQGADRVEQALATLIGCERALLGPSTLHLFWDLFGTLARRDVGVLVDAASYPIARWGVERAAARGTPVQTFRAHDVQALRRLLRNLAPRRPVIVSDGYSPACGAMAPLAEYLECIRPLDGLLVVDDTQALGVYGRPQAGRPFYGKGGGGSLRWTGLSDARIVMVSSLAKAFGAPVAVLAGSAALVTAFERESATRTHCSPPSAAVIAAAARALRVNRQSGDALRLQLAQRVMQFRRGMRRLNLVDSGSLFPMQSVRTPDRIDARDLHERLQAHGVLSVLHRGRDGAAARISFLITTRHTAADIDRALTAVHLVTTGLRSTVRKGGRGDDTQIADSAGAVQRLLRNSR